jgi:hypothetical protein
MSIATIGTGAAAVSMGIDDEVRAGSRRSRLGVNLSLLATRHAVVSFQGPNGVRITLSQAELHALATASNTTQRAAIIARAFTAAAERAGVSGFDATGNAMRALNALSRLSAASIREGGTAAYDITLRSDSNDMSSRTDFVRTTAAVRNGTACGVRLDTPHIHAAVSVGMPVRTR